MYSRACPGAKTRARTCCVARRRKVHGRMVHRRNGASPHLMDRGRNIRERPSKQRTDRIHPDKRRRVSGGIKSVYIEVNSDRPKSPRAIVPIVTVGRQRGRLNGAGIGGIRRVGGIARGGARQGIGGITRVFVPIGSLLV